MKRPTARKSMHTPVRALTLGVILAGTVLAASATNHSPSPVSFVQQITPPSTRVTGGLPHQVAPLETVNEIFLVVGSAPSSSGITGVPHQVAPLDGLRDAIVAENAPATSRFGGGLPHQVAPLEGGDVAALNASIIPATSRFGGGLPHQVAPLEGGDG